MRAIPYMQIRGGSSKGIYFLAADLPTEQKEREQFIIDVVGRDSRQIDGLGGGHSLTSKVAIISQSHHPDADIDYLFVQVVVGENRVDTSPNCGNILAGVGAFAIESGLIDAQEGQTCFRVHMVNSGNFCDLVLETPGKTLSYQGDTQIDGVPGTSAPIICNYLNISGSLCGSLLPTGNPTDYIEGIAVTCIDNGMPVVIILAKDLGLSGYESCEELNTNLLLKARLESIRLHAGNIMKLGDVSDKVVPKMTLIAPPRQGGHVSTRTFIPHTCHSAIGVLGAVSVATACVIEGSVAFGISPVPEGNTKQLSVEHPSGEFSLNLTLDEHGNVAKAGLLRTARLLARGELYI
ncbi:4-oxalomesaconate tautomerase [Parasalinivibrio latis]|uniref:4-oxalomesaconate tautomerase n=1 Tax=Parasalinivibrio latis TaxID=2952610 RepID=UPI0030DE06B6